MTIPGFILRNALRNKRRLTLTVLSVALSLFLFTVLQTALRELSQPQVTEQSALRLIVRHKVTLANVLPLKYKSRIERVPGVKRVSRLTWFGGIYIDESNFFAQFGCDPNALFDILTEVTTDPEQVAAFKKEKTACMVGIKTMNRFGWKIGQKITLRGTIYPANLELTIRGVYHGGIDETNLFFHHEYLDESTGWRVVGCYWILAANADAVADVIQRVDGMFSSSNAETKTETERAFQLTFISWFGNVKLLIGSICTVIVFTMMLVTASTMSMAIRERTREIAVLKALGYNGGQIFSLILAESFGMALAGGLIGCVGTWFLAQHVDMYALSHGFFIKFEVTQHIVAAGLLIATAMGVVSCLAPAIASVRASVLDGLRELD
jgi:putative ABC transport system permease protein